MLSQVWVNMSPFRTLSSSQSKLTTCKIYLFLSFYFYFFKNLSFISNASIKNDSGLDGDFPDFSDTDSEVEYQDVLINVQVIELTINFSPW